MSTELIVVLDVDDPKLALEIVDACGRCQYFKIGAQLFTRCGPSIVEAVQAMGKDVMLDLKYHDIPNTVKHAAQAAADLNVSLMTLHALGGRAMIQTAREAVEGSKTRILAVTILTSHSDQTIREDLGLQEDAKQAVPRLAKLAVDAGAHGIVCSPEEIVLVREAVGSEPLIVTPGIRPAWATKDDQSRVMTPRQAAEAGASMIVVGRPILKHESPSVAVDLVLEELQG